MIFKIINNTGLIHGLKAGLDTLVFTCTNACGSATAQQTMTVLPLPDPGTIIGVDSLCLGETATFTDVSANGPGYWLTGSMSADSAYTVLAASSYGPVKLTYSMANKCGSKTATKTIQVLNTPNGLLTSGPNALCLGAEVMLTNYVKGGYWYARNGNLKIDSFTGLVQTVTPGIDTVIYVYANICGADSDLFMQTVHAVPPVLNPVRNENLLRVDSGYAGYQWLMDGMPVDGAIADTCTAAQTGVYQVLVSNSWGCTTQSGFLNISHLEPCQVSDIKIYPNPAASIVYVRWCDYADVAVSTLEGKLILADRHARDIDLSAIPDGNYVFTLYREDGGRVVSKLIAKVSR